VYPFFTGSDSATKRSGSRTSRAGFGHQGIGGNFAKSSLVPVTHYRVEISADDGDYYYFHHAEDALVGTKSQVIAEIIARTGLVSALLDLSFYLVREVGC
jgi:hypothetical protein